jgi:hypothetical protein
VRRWPIDRGQTGLAVATTPSGLLPRVHCPFSGKFSTNTAPDWVRLAVDSQLQPPSREANERLLFAAAAFLCALSNGAHARDDRLPAEFVGDWCLAEHTADHLAFYHRGRCANAANVDDSLTISPDSFDAPEMHCRLLVARANKRGDYLAQFWCDDEMIQNYWFSLSGDRLYVSLTDREP